MRLWESRRMKRIVQIALVAALVCVMGLALAASYPFTGVTTDDTTMRRTPNSSQANVITKIPEGMQVTVLGASGNFYRVEYGGETGYVFKQYVEESAGGAA